MREAKLCGSRLVLQLLLLLLQGANCAVALFLLLVELLQQLGVPVFDDVDAVSGAVVLLVLKVIFLW